MELELDPYGPTLPDVVSGVIPFPHGVSYEFAFPNVKTSGTLTLNGKPYRVSGTSWLDREWGLIGPIKWTWMGIRLKSGVEISLWSQQSCDQNGKPTPDARPRSFATILNSDSNITVSTVELEEGKLFRHSNGQDYPQEWEVTIPGKCEGLKVTVSSDNQAIKSDMIPRLEAKAYAIGTYEGRQVECDHVFVEAGVILLSSTPAQQPANGGQANVAQNASPGSASPAAVGGLVRETRTS